MKHSKQNQYLLALSLICLIALFSCRKKDERYEGYYVGEERHTYLDSGATTYSLDTTYVQEVEITYTKVTNSNKKAYNILRIFNNPDNQFFQQLRKSIVDHEYIGEGGGLKFSGDSMYMYSSNFNDQIENWDTETWEFKGKRN